MVAQTASPHLPPAVQPVRAVVWVLHLAIPMAGLWLLLAQPPADVRWQHAVSHFWLVLVVAAVNIVLGVRMSVVAHRRDDARLFLVSLAFLASAGFFLLHALATPGMVVHHPNLGFDLGATDVQLQASPMGEPIYRRMGYEDAYRREFRLTGPPT